jgi:hypothetical protein
MKTSELAMKLQPLLEPFDALASFVSLHYAARIITHVSHHATNVPWIKGMLGEPQESEKALAWRIVKAAQATTGRPVTEWDAVLATQVIDVLVEQALNLSRLTWGDFDRPRAAQFLATCRDDRWDRWNSEIQLRLVDGVNIDELLSGLTPDEQQVVTMRAKAVPWQVVAQLTGGDEAVARVTYSRGLRKILTAMASQDPEPGA